MTSVMFFQHAPESLLIGTAQAFPLRTALRRLDVKLVQRLLYVVHALKRLFGSIVLVFLTEVLFKTLNEREPSRRTVSRILLCS